MNDDAEGGGPFIPNAWDPPGRWDGWTGEQRWRTRHGPAIVYWDTGRINKVDGAHLYDGRRLSVEGPRVGSPTSRIPSTNGQGFVHGVLSIQNDDVEFIPLSRNPVLYPRDDVRPAFEALRKSHDFMAFVGADFLHAYAAYSVLQNKNLSLPNGDVTALGERSAAGMIAALRQNGEDYLDFFVADQHYEAAESFLETVRDILARNGFKI